MSVSNTDYNLEAVLDWLVEPRAWLGGGGGECCGRPGRRCVGNGKGGGGEIF
jgi:hypothetical protein